MQQTTVCYACSRQYDATEQRCSCGEPLWFESLARTATWPTTTDTSMWRYETFLPVDNPGSLVASVGGTPLVRTVSLDTYAGCSLSVKIEGANPTGSFKDRGSAVAVAAALERDIEWIGTVSHGNMAISMASLAAASELKCLALVPDDISSARLRAIGQFDPTLLRVDGDYGRLYHDTMALGDLIDIEFTNSDSPRRVAGQKTVAFEICESFAPDVPDAIALPVSSGGNASAIWKGLRELRAAGLLDTLPRLYWVQAAACDPIARAYRDSSQEVTRVEPAETVAYSIGNHDPPSGTRALRAARETGGAVVSVSENEILDATAAFATEAGLCVEPASAVALAGVRTLADVGEISDDEEVVCVATGTGFKELDHLDAGSDVRTIEREHLEETLASLT